MSAGTPSDRVPEILDAWRMVAARRGVEGRLPLSALTRLEDSLLDTKGEVRFALEFDRDSLQVPYVELRIDAELPLVCQRSMDRFLLPVRIVQRLGLIRDEADEAALPEGYEPLLVPDDGELRTAELVEDELILAVPVVPVKPGSEAVERDWPATQVEQERANPFAALSALKKPDK
ncbi:YceD family protein [Lysobacter sp. P5_B9]